MPKILIVEDEEGYRRQLEIGLSLPGYEVRSASSGREALDLGVRYRPDLVVTDWMLKDDIHGMHVVEVLRAMLSDLKAIMITGFASGELRQEARSAEVSEFIEKPFSLDRIRRAVDGALASRSGKTLRPALAVIEVSKDGSISYANTKALELFEDTEAGREAQRVSDLFPAGNLPDFDDALDRWKVASPLANRPVTWHIRTQELQEDGKRLAVLRRSDEPQYLGMPLIEMLLGSISPKYAQWPFDGRAVVIDSEPAVRKWAISMIESVGGGCYAVDDPTQALRLLESDDGLRFVILDLHTAGADPAGFVGQVKSVRSDIVIVGNSSTDRRQAFADMGVDHFIQKPWRVDDLISLLAGRIGNCVECGLPLPLRRPRSEEQAGSWVCSNCGANYRGVLDEDASEAILRNVHPRTAN